MQGKADLATKQDIESLKQEMKVSMSELKVELIKWVTGALIAQAAVIATLVKLLWRLANLIIPNHLSRSGNSCVDG